MENVENVKNNTNLVLFSSFNIGVIKWHMMRVQLKY